MTLATILVVDDQSGIRELLCHVLTGFEVIAAASIKEAWRVIGERCVDCVLTDIHMPDGSGIELAGHLQHSHPKMPVLLMTGHSLATVAKQVEHLAVPTFTKPLDLDELTRVLELMVPG